MSDIKKKLQIKDEMRGTVTGLPKGLEIGVPHNRNGTDFSIVFVNNKADIDRTAEKAIGRLREDGMLWYCYPKKSSGVETDINRDTGWQAVQDQNWRGVRQISIDSTWSAIRFRDSRFVK